MTVPSPADLPPPTVAQFDMALYVESVCPAPDLDEHLRVMDRILDGRAKARARELLAVAELR